MIDLRLKVDPLPIDTPLVVRLREELCEDRGPHDAVLLDVAGDRREYDFNGFSLGVYARTGEIMDGDVLLLLPGQVSAHRLIREPFRSTIPFLSPNNAIRFASCARSRLKSITRTCLSISR